MFFARAYDYVFMFSLHQIITNCQNKDRKLRVVRKRLQNEMKMVVILWGRVVEKSNLGSIWSGENGQFSN